MIFRMGGVMWRLVFYCCGEFRYAVVEYEAVVKYCEGWEEAEK